MTGSSRSSRRALLKAAAALPIAAAAAHVGVAAKAAAAAEPLKGGRAFDADGRIVRPQHVLADTRFAEIAPLVDLARRDGVRVHAVHDDLTALWNAELARAWRAAPQRLAGLTTQGALFVLETLAADHGMRVVYRGTHAPRVHGRCEHHFAGPTAALDGWLAAWRRDDVAAPWEAVASTLLALPRGAAPAAARTVVRADTSALDSRDAPLVSWVIAPRGTSALAV